MPQLDRLLSHVIARGGTRLHLEADRKPRLELKNGEAMDLLPNPLPALMVDVLAGEVVPGNLKAAWQKEGKAEFEHELSGQVFRIRLDRKGELPDLIADLLGPAHPQPTAASIPAPSPAPRVAAAPGTGGSPASPPVGAHGQPPADRPV